MGRNSASGRRSRPPSPSADRVSLCFPAPTAGRLPLPAFASSAFALTAAASLFVFAIAVPVSAQHIQQEIAALQKVPAFPPDTVAPPPTSTSALPQSDAPPQAPTQNWALPTPPP